MHRNDDEHVDPEGGRRDGERERDSVYGDAVLWRGKPRKVTVPRICVIASLVCAVLSVVSLSFAILVATSLHASPTALLGWSAWSAVLGVAFWRVPIVFRSEVEYVVTERHVIWRRGRLRRTIERRGVSYARIHWSGSARNVGDLVLVRAVPTGALRRTLSLTLSDVDVPDRVWAIVRGAPVTPSLGDGDRPVTQRLDPGERVVWSATPSGTRWPRRRIVTLVVSIGLALAALRFAIRLTPELVRLVTAHALSTPGFILLFVAVSLSFLLLVSSAAGVGYAAWLRPKRLLGETRYLVTDRRVLIRRGDEELHLDRSKIADVIDETNGALHDVFLVLDGPNARALAASGAFGEAATDDLRPVISCIQDSESLRAALATHVDEPELHDAA